MRGQITACVINVCSCLASIKLIIVGSLMSPGHGSFSPCACVYICFASMCLCFTNKYTSNKNTILNSTLLINCGGLLGQVNFRWDKENFAALVLQDKWISSVMPWFVIWEFGPLSRMWPAPKLTWFIHKYYILVNSWSLSWLMYGCWVKQSTELTLLTWQL